MSILGLLLINEKNLIIPIIALIFALVISGISVGSYALISIRDLCLTKGNLSDRMNHIGLFIPIIIVISYLIKFIINLLFFEIYDGWLEKDYEYIYFIFISFVYLIFNLLGFILNEGNEIENIELPKVIPSIVEFIKRKRILTFILLYFICQIEKLFWEIFFGVTSHFYFNEKKDKTKYKTEDLIAFIIFLPPILFGFIFDKFDFLGFKGILYTGSLINVLSIFYCFFLINKNRKIFGEEYVFLLSIINEIFRAGNYAIFLPEIIKKFEIKNLLILSGIISASNFFVQPLEIGLTNFFIEKKGDFNQTYIIVLLIIQICCSIIVFLLLFLKIVNENLGMGKLGEITDVKGKDFKMKFNDDDDSDINSLDCNNSKLKLRITEMNTKNNTSYNLIEE